MIKTINTQILTLFIFLIAYYLLVIVAFTGKLYVSMDFPVLAHRFGTVLWHSSDKDGKYQGNNSGNFHTYCYYPGDPSQNFGGEVIIKKVDNFKDCQGWYGIAIFQEDWWISEQQKYSGIKPNLNI